MKKLAFIILLSVAPSFARVLTFIPRNFDEFVSKMVPEKEQKLFKGYYAELQGKVAKEKEESQKKTRHYINSKALASLEENHAVWNAEINHFLTDLQFLDEAYDNERSEVRSFLNWYGAYQEYDLARNQQNQKMAAAKSADEKNEGFLNNAKNYVAKATQKIGGWFKGWRKSKTV